ncbi:protein of unknown function [Sterolibacterium denitrificans]|uniref:Uncharacterized protein n=1 Tax=Sterolibacterium denitrificans TaxID=157592 RepID=A0A7Z7HNU2_9PROT|nr:protein of unknown function [Sterolibacterium denitrificans]
MGLASRMSTLVTEPSAATLRRALTLPLSTPSSSASLGKAGASLEIALRAFWACAGAGVIMVSVASNAAIRATTVSGFVPALRPGWLCWIAEIMFHSIWYMQKCERRLLIRFS